MTEKKMTEKKYYRVTSRHTSEIAFNVDVKNGKETENCYISISGSFPRPNPSNMKPGINYLNQAEKDALNKEPSFNEFEENGLFSVQAINFRDMPDDKQKEYDAELFRKNKTNGKK